MQGGGPALFWQFRDLLSRVNEAQVLLIQS